MKLRKLIFVSFIVGCSVAGAPFDCDYVTGYDEYGRPVMKKTYTTRAVQDQNGVDKVKIHYVTEGAHASDPAKIEFYAEGLASAYNYHYFQHDYFTCWEPYNCWSDCTAGGDPLIDVYSWDPIGVVNGRTLQDLVHPPDCTNSSYHINVKAVPTATLIYPSDLAKQELIYKITAAHEFNHLATRGEGSYEQFWSEGHATMVANDLYNIFTELPLLGTIMITNYLGCSDITLWASAWEEVCGPYAPYAPFFHYFLREKFNDLNIIENISDAAQIYQTNGPISKRIDDALIAKGTSFAEVFPQFAEWNYMTCKNDDGQHYQWNSGACPVASVKLQGNFTPGSYPTTMVTMPSDKGVGSASANYIVFETNTDTQRTFVMTLNVPEAIAGVSVIRKNKGIMTYDLALIEAERTQFTGAGEHSIVLPNWDQYEKVIIVIHNSETVHWNLVSYNYRLD